MLPVTPSAVDLAAENQQLRDENARLRALLAGGDGEAARGDGALSAIRLSTSHQALLSQLPAGIVYIDAQRSLHFNRHVEAIIGYTAAEIPRLDAWFETLYPGRSQAVRAIYEGSREVGFPHPSIVPVRHRDGGTRHVRFQGYRDPTTEYWLLTDVTEEVTAQTALKQNEAFLRGIYEGTEVATWVMDVEADGTIRFVSNNPAHERFSGLEQTYLAGRTPDDLVPRIPAEIVAIIKGHYQRCLDERASIAYEECIPIDGKETWWMTRLTPLFEGDRIWRIIGSAINIDAQKRVEYELRESEAFNQLLLEASPDLTYVFDFETMGNVFMSGQVGQLLGLDDWEPGQPVNPEIHPDDLAGLQVHFATRMASQDDQIHELEYRVRHSDGAWRWVVDRALPFQRNTEGDVRTIIGTVRDITDRKAHEEELERMNAELKQFAYVTSHDLSEPLRTIRSFLNLFRRHYGEHVDERSAEYLRFVNESAERMQQLLQDLLAYSRATNGELNQVDVDLELEVKRIARTLAKNIEETGATITTEHLPVVQGDRSTLSVLLQNLISNALKFRGDAAPQIHISAEEAPEEWIIRVEDNGIGFEPRHAKRIFKVFQRLHTREAFPGTGIGLAICKRVVERHGGQIEASGTPGEGAIFTFTLAR